MMRATCCRLCWMCIGCVFLTNCSRWQKDPLEIGNTSMAPACPWNPARYQCVDVCCASSEETVAAFSPTKELSLSSMIDLALQNNPSTKRAWVQARASAFALGAAKSAFYPAVGVREWLNSSGDDWRHCCDKRGLVSSLSLSYLLLDFGGRDAAIESACMALYASNWNHNQVIQQVILSVLQDYYAYVTTLELLEASESDLKNAKANLEAAHVLFEAGIKTKLDVLQAETDLVTIELTILNLQGQVKAAKAALAAALGLPPQTDFLVSRLPDAMHLPEVLDDIDRLMALAKEKRPDLAAAFADYQQAESQIAIARSSAWPTLKLEADWQHNKDLYRSSLSNNCSTIGLVLHVPLFNGFLYDNQIKQAKELSKAALARWQSTELAVLLDVATSYYHFQTAVEAYRYSQEFLALSQETYQAALIYYQEGVGTILDLLLGQRNLSAARAQMIQARTRWAVALANLAFAAGILDFSCACKH
jgi:outer membrane protein